MKDNKQKIAQLWALLGVINGFSVKSDTELMRLLSDDEDEKITEELVEDLREGL